jgi:hypothetical protein
MRANAAVAKGHRGRSVSAVSRRHDARRVRRGATLALLAVTLVGPQPAWARNGVHEGTSRGYSGCVRTISSRYGAYVEVTARMSVNWKSASRATVHFANNESVVEDCGPSGRQTGGGQLSFHTRIEFIGDQIESCWAGCTIDPHHNQATYEYSHGPVDNTDGKGALRVAGIEVNTGNTGHIYSVKFITRTTLSKDGESATGQTIVDLHY